MAALSKRSKAQQQPQQRPTAVATLLFCVAATALLLPQAAAQGPNGSEPVLLPPTPVTAPAGPQSTPPNPSSAADTTPLGPNSTPGGPIQQQQQQATGFNDSPDASSGTGRFDSGTDSGMPAARTAGLGGVQDPRDAKTATAVQQIAQQQANNVTTVLSGGPNGTNMSNDPDVVSAQGNLQSLGESRLNAESLKALLYCRHCHTVQACEGSWPVDNSVADVCCRGFRPEQQRGAPVDTAAALVRGATAQHALALRPYNKQCHAGLQSCARQPFQS